MRIRGTVAIVTGASSGIGEATAVALARRGAHVVAVARRLERLEETVTRCVAAGGSAEPRPLDVADRAACEELVSAIEAERGRVDIVVNNAGIPMRKHASRTTIDDIERVVAVNLLGSMYVAVAALPGMLERRRGAVVNVSSVAGGVPNPREAAYGATKAAITHWTHSLAVDLAGSGVHAGVVIPGPIETEIWEKLDEPPAYEGRFYPPEDVADAVVSIVEDERVQLTVPRHHGVFGALYPLLHHPFRWGLVRFDRRSARRHAGGGPAAPG